MDSPEQLPRNLALATESTPVDLVEQTVGAVIVVEVETLLPVAVDDGEVEALSQARVDADVLGLAGREPPLESTHFAVVAAAGTGRVLRGGVFVVPFDFARVATCRDGGGADEGGEEGGKGGGLHFCDGEGRRRDEVNEAVVCVCWTSMSVDDGGSNRS